MGEVFYLSYDSVNHLVGFLPQKVIGVGRQR